MSTSDNNFPKQPRFKVVKVDSAIPLAESHLSQLLDGKKGITLLVRSDNGEKKRGGYFFCISRNADGNFNLETIEQERVDYQFTLCELTRFVNHTAGLQFDKEILQLCQSKINFRTDEE